MQICIWQAAVHVLHWNFCFKQVKLWPNRLLPLCPCWPVQPRGCMLNHAGFVNHSLFLALQAWLEYILCYVKTFPGLSLLCVSLCYTLRIIKMLKADLVVNSLFKKSIKFNSERVPGGFICNYLFCVLPFLLLLQNYEYKSCLSSRTVCTIISSSIMNYSVTNLNPNLKLLHLLLTLASSSFSMSSLDEENSLRVILGVLSPWPTEPIISCSFSWFTSAYMLIQGIFLIFAKGEIDNEPPNDVRKPSNEEIVP